MGCVSLPCLARGHQPVLWDCEPKRPSARGGCGGHPPPHRRDSTRKHCANCLQISPPATSVLLTCKTGSFFSLWTVWILCRDCFFLSWRVAGIKLVTQDSDLVRPVVWNAVFSSTLWLYYSPVLISLPGFSGVFICCFCFVCAFYGTSSPHGEIHTPMLLGFSILAFLIYCLK